VIRESLRRDRGQFINQPRFQAKVRAMFGIDGENPVPSLSELLPVVVIENDRVESMYDGNEFIRINGASLAAAPGFASQVALVNPIGSGVLVIVEQIACVNTVAGRLSAGSVLTAAPYILSANPGVPRDGRASGGGGAPQIWTSQTAAAPAEQFRLYGGGNGLLEVGWVLNPNQGLVMWAPTVGALNEVYFIYRDRALNSV